MLKIHEITEFLEQQFPLELAYDWDNVGLQIGDQKKSVGRIMAALEATTPVIDEAIRQGVELIITHHPFIFPGIKAINLATPKGKNIEKLIKNDMALYTMHTNYDLASGGMNDVLAAMMKLENVKPLCDDGLGRLGELQQAMNIDCLCDYIQHEWLKDVVSDIRTVEISGKSGAIKKVALIGGSGGDYINEAKNAGADVLVTGDIKYHTAIDAQELGLNLIDISHYAESVMEANVQQLLQAKFDNQLEVLIPSVAKNPIL